MIANTLMVAGFLHLHLGFFFLGEKARSGQNRFALRRLQPQLVKMRKLCVNHQVASCRFPRYLPYQWPFFLCLTAGQSAGASTGHALPSALCGTGITDGPFLFLSFFCGLSKWWFSFWLNGDKKCWTHIYIIVEWASHFAMNTSRFRRSNCHHKRPSKLRPYAVPGTCKDFPFPEGSGRKRCTPSFGFSSRGPLIGLLL